MTPELRAARSINSHWSILPLSDNLAVSSSDEMGLSYSAKSAGDFGRHTGQNVRMLSKRAYQEELIRRTHRLRLASGLTQEEMAEFLGVTLDAYGKYERNVPMPPHLYEQFTRFARVDLDMLVTGRGAPRIDPPQRRNTKRTRLKK